MTDDKVILKVEGVTKQYRLGLVGTGTLRDDLKRLWYGIRGKEDPFLKVGDVNNRSTLGESNYVWALKDINFEVKRGEVLGIIGKNGAGKSTLLKILSRVTSPTTGEIKSRGRIASLLEVGTGFHPELTGRENIYLNGAILGMSKTEIKSKEEEIISFSGCERYVDTPVKRYSSGMRVRVAFAVAAFLEPDILVIDEVLAVGDAEFQKKAIGKMQDISKSEGRTVLFVSHNLESVQKLCTRCIIMVDGIIGYDGEVKKAISYYLKNNVVLNKDDDFPLELNKLSIRNFAIIDSLRSKTDSLILGNDYTFTLDMVSLNKTKIEANIRLQIIDDFENIITTLNTYHTVNTQMIQYNELVRFECNIEKLQISSGNYKVGIQIFDLIKKQELYHNNAFHKFTIINGDYYGTGRIPRSSNLGKFLTNYSWMIKANN